MTYRLVRYPEQENLPSMDVKFAQCATNFRERRLQVPIIHGRCRVKNCLVERAGGSCDRVLFESSRETGAGGGH